MPAKKPRNKVTYKPNPLPAEGFVRLPSVLNVLGVSRSTFLEGAKTGKYPKGKLLSPRCRIWVVSEIGEVLAKIEAA